MRRKDENIDVSNNTSLRQFEAVVAGHKAVLQYRFEDSSIVFTHTEVPYALQGRGVGSVLARAGLDYAANHALAVIPLCPFVERYIRRHPERLTQVEPKYRARRFADTDAE
jgi:predicted GNAT family acetyltransferase